MNTTTEYNELFAKSKQIQDEIKQLKDEIARLDGDFDCEDEGEKEELNEVFVRMKEEKNEDLKYKEDELNYIQEEMRLFEIEMEDSQSL